MIEVKIKNLNGVQTHQQVFETQGEVDAWIAQEKANGTRCSWGHPAWTETLEDETTVEHEDQFTVEIIDLGNTPLYDILRQDRNQKLKESDWTQLSDSPLSTQDKLAWSIYRQLLRDLPANTNDPSNPTWPEIP
jgi:hypothetical protein